MSLGWFGQKDPGRFSPTSKLKPLLAPCLSVQKRSRAAGQTYSFWHPNLSWPSTSCIQAEDFSQGLPRLLHRLSGWTSTWEKHIKAQPQLCLELVACCELKMFLQAGFLRGRHLERFRRAANIEDLESLLCVICWDEAIKPITIECGHTICLYCFMNKASSSSCCSSCWEFSQLKSLQADIVMHPEGEGMCEIHQEDQKFFCDRNKTLLCVTCSKSEDHNYHIHWPIAVAAFRYRKKIKLLLEILGGNVNKIQQLLLKEEKPLTSWVVVWAAHSGMSRKMLEKKIQESHTLLKGKEENAKEEELILDMNKKFKELYQRLMEAEVTQEDKIMEQKKEWRAMKSIQSKLLTDKITELKEKNQKPDLAILQDVTEILQRGVFQPSLEPFIPRMDASYLMIATEFLKFFHGYRLLKNHNFYNLSKDKKRTITFITDSLGKTFAIYTTGNVQAEAINGREFSVKLWTQERITEEEGCTFCGVI